MSTREIRASLADVINEAAVYGRTTYVTHRGRRVAAVVPVPVADAALVERPQGQR
jgi:antitoxin (DNA-binding transcriptional repressor) of toxin-antitoxin stability system